MKKDEIIIEVPDTEEEISNDEIEVDFQNHTVSERLIPWPKGEDGVSPTEEQLIALIEPRIPKLKQPKDWKTPTKTEIKEIIKEVLPEEKLIEKIVKKIPTPKDGEKWDDGKSFRFADLTAYEKQILTWPQGSSGVWVPRGGTTNQILAKHSSKDFDTEWIDNSGGGGGSVFVNWVEVTDPNFEDTAEIAITATGSDVNFAIVNGSIDESKLDTSVNVSLGKADTAVQPADLSPYELLANKSTDTALGTSNSLYPTQNAVKTYVDSSVVGLLDDRGNYDASVNTFPASGGSGTAGAILKGDLWIISAAGTLGGSAVEIGDQIRALVDTPWQTASNWAISQANIGYVPENVANKENTTIDTSTTKYPTVNLLKTGLDTKQATLVSGTNIKTVNSTTLLGSGDIAVATTAQGALADSALQPTDIASWTITARADDINFSGGSDWDVLTVQADGSLALEAPSGGSGANTALSNLASVAINTSLVSDTDNTDNIGSSLIKWATGFFTNLGATGTRITKGWFTDIESTNIPTVNGSTLASALNLSGTNTWDQTSIVGITGTLAEFNTALTGADFATGGGTVTGTSSWTNTGDQTSVTGNAWTATALQTARTIGTATGDVTSAGSTFDGSANNTNAYTLATVNSNVGSFGSATQSLSATVNGKGLITAISAQTVTPAVGSITGLGTGVATALAVNVGSAGAPVLFNWAGGTPSSLVLTNATWLPTAGLVDDAVTLAKMASGTAWNLITYDASGNPAAVATGTAWQVLTSNGSWAAPTMQTRWMYLKKTSSAMSSNTITVTDSDVTTTSGIIWNASAAPTGFIQVTTASGSVTFTSTASETCSFTYYILN